MSKHATMKSGPDLERALAELKAAGVKVLDWTRVGREIFYKVMLPKPIVIEPPPKMELLREYKTAGLRNTSTGNTVTNDLPTSSAFRLPVDS